MNNLNIFIIKNITFLSKFFFFFFSFYFNIGCKILYMESTTKILATNDTILTVQYHLS